jgi:hypothetical protein
MKLPNSRKDLPEPSHWTRLVGPGAIMVATSLGSGEIYFWPNLSAQIGTWVLLLGLAAIGIQYVINTEVSRYTLATGETIIQGFQRLAGFLPWVILACCTFPWVWPGWAMILGGIFILVVLNITQPPSLLVVAGSLSAVAMFVYTLALLVMNRSAAKTWSEKVCTDRDVFNPFVVSRFRSFVLMVACVLFGVLSFYAVVSRF